MFQDVHAIHLVVQQVETVGGLLLGLGVQRLLEPPELQWRCAAHANLPPLAPVRRTPNQGPFPLPRSCCPRHTSGTVDPSDTQRGFCQNAEERAATPRRLEAPVPCPVLCRRATPRTPVSDPMVVGRLLPWSPAAFPVFTAGRPPKHHFRGLPRLHSRCGPPACQFTHGDSVSRELRQLGYSPCRLGSYRGVPTTPQAGLAPARTKRFSRRGRIMQVSSTSNHSIALTSSMRLENPSASVG